MDLGVAHLLICYCRALVLLRLRSALLILALIASLFTEGHVSMQSS
jgi:hypothetical protein